MEGTKKELSQKMKLKLLELETPYPTVKIVFFCEALLK